MGKLKLSWSLNDYMTEDRGYDIHSASCDGILLSVAEKAIKDINKKEYFPCTVHIIDNEGTKHKYRSGIIYESDLQGYKVGDEVPVSMTYDPEGETPKDQMFIKVGFALGQRVTSDMVDLTSIATSKPKAKKKKKAKSPA